jgi:tellurite resistance protein
MMPQEKVEILRASCCVAGADQNTSGAEKQLLEKLAGKIGVGAASLNAMIERSETDPEFHKCQFDILKTEPTKTMAILIEVAVADGTISDSETGVLTNLGANLGVDAAIVNQLIAAACNS